MILCIDDDIELLRNTILNLTDAEYDAKIIGDIDQAIEYLSVHYANIDGIIMDIMMPPGKLFRDKEHKGGLLTGIFLAQYFITQQNYNCIPKFFYSNCRQQDALQMADEINVQVYTKSRYSGSRIVPLVEEEFDL